MTVFAGLTGADQPFASMYPQSGGRVLARRGRPTLAMVVSAIAFLAPTQVSGGGLPALITGSGAGERRHRPMA
jgi:hypothetical protein